MNRIQFENKKLITKFDIKLDFITKLINTMNLKEFVLDREKRMVRKEGREKQTYLGISIKEKTNFTKNIIFQVEINFVKEIKMSLL